MERGISQSGLSKYRDCPHSYYLHYHLKKKPMFFDTGAMDTGGFAHKAVEVYYKNNFLMNGTSENILYYTYNNLKNIWDITLPTELFKKAYTCLYHHSLWEEGNIKKGLTKPLVEVEHDANGYYGFIDYVNLLNKQVIDFKTNKYATLSYKFRMQAHSYKELFEDKFKQELTHFYFFFLYPNEWRCVKYDSDKQREVAREMEKLKEGILNCKFPKKPRTASGCNSCNYKFYCKVLGV